MVGIVFSYSGQKYFYMSFCMIKSTEFGKSRIDVYFRKERRMRHKSTELMGTIKAFVEEYYKNYRHSPSTTQIADAVSIARRTAESNRSPPSRPSRLTGRISCRRRRQMQSAVPDYRTCRKPRRRPDRR